MIHPMLIRELLGNEEFRLAITRGVESAELNSVMARLLVPMLRDKLGNNSMFSQMLRQLSDNQLELVVFTWLETPEDELLPLDDPFGFKRAYMVATESGA